VVRWPPAASFCTPARATVAARTSIGSRHCDLSAFGDPGAIAAVQA
jgi:hypothetical protein